MASITTQAANEKALKKLDYTSQGDPDLLTNRMMRKREANRDDKQVLASLQAFWDSVMHDARPSEGVHTEETTASAILTHDEYLSMFTRVAKTLEPRGAKVSEATKEDNKWWGDVPQDHVEATAEQKKDEGK